MTNSRPGGRFHVDRSLRNPNRRIKRGLLAICLTILGSQANAEYRVNVGDVLEIAVVGLPELQRRAAVQIDGSISLPLVGTLPVAGQPLPKIREQIGAALASKSLRVRTPDGHENVIVIDADEVTASVAEYRPIYVNGDVSKPGEYPYRPSTTVRQLIAMAGGFDIMHSRVNDPYLKTDLKAEYSTLWTEFAKGQARIWRIKNELGDGSQSDLAVGKDVPLPLSVISEIVKGETEYLRTQQTDYEREKAFLQRGIREGDDHVNVLLEQQKTEEEGYHSDLDELQKVKDLFGQGSLVSPRVTDSRRAVLLSSTRELQTSAQLMEVKKQQDELKRKLERLDDQRRLDLLRELQDANVSLDEIRVKLQSVGEKLQYVATVRSQFVPGASDNAEIAVIRKGEKGQERIIADEDAELQPGDTVEIALRLQDPDAPAGRLSSLNIP
jgi:polysaccharide biosynthesis/export protein